jgi:hypothetical protein
MAGYSQNPLWKKLGYKDGTQSYVCGEPGHYLALLELPEEIEVEWLARPISGMRFVHVFSKAASDLRSRLKSLRKVIAPEGVVWVSWPKRGSGVATDVTEDVIRDLALPLGFVDIKVCAVDGVWSGLKLMIRRDQR